jgi:hypothetical protein
MARHWFGQSLTDWSMALGEETEIEGVKYRPVSATGPVAVTFWNAASGGTQYTDLLDASGSTITQVTTSDGTGGLPLGTIPRFRGPDGDPEIVEMWADAGGTARYLMPATDLGTYVSDLRTRMADLEATVELLKNSLGVLVYDGGWPERPADDRPYAWIGPSAPSGSGNDLWANTAP